MFVTAETSLGYLYCDPEGFIMTDDVHEPGWRREDNRWKATGLFFAEDSPLPSFFVGACAIKLVFDRYCCARELSGVL